MAHLIASQPDSPLSYKQKSFECLSGAGRKSKQKLDLTLPVPAPIRGILERELVCVAISQAET